MQQYNFSRIKFSIIYIAEWILPTTVTYEANYNLKVTGLTGLISNTKSFTLLRDSENPENPLIPDSRLSRGTSQDNGRWILVVSKFPVSTRLVTRFSHASTNGYGWLGYTFLTTDVSTTDRGRAETA